MPPARRAAARSLLVLFALATGPGCSPPQQPVDLSKIKERLDSLAQKQEEDSREMQEIDSRLFLLEDKVDTLKVAGESSGKSPRLQVVRIQHGDGNVREERKARPSAPVRDETPPAAAANAPIVEVPPSGGDSLVESQSVEYDGEARRGGEGRPVLRLYGPSDVASSSSGPGVSSGAGSPSATGTTLTSNTRGSSALASLDPELLGEKLPVVPLPGARAAQQARVDSSAEAIKLYKQGRSHYLAGDYSGAMGSFKAFLERHKGHPYADNALYWLGECFYDTRDFRQALATFRRVVELYPEGNKVPDSLLKMGFCHARLGSNESACNVLNQVVGSYPGSGVVSLARSSLTKMKCNPEGRP